MTDVGDIMVAAGEQVPRFDVTTLDGTRISYAATLWQRMNLVLIALGTEESPDADGWLEEIAASLPELSAHDTAVVITRDPVPGLPSPVVVVADRWGEVYFAGTADRIAGLASPAEIIEWLRFFQMIC
jgi:hypothetical protein